MTKKSLILRRAPLLIQLKAKMILEIIEFYSLLGFSLVNVGMLRNGLGRGLS
jgi:hypothetical protein